MVQTDAGWGAGPSARYEDLATGFRPVFARIRATAVTRDRERTLPHEEIGWLKQAGFTTLRLARDAGGFDASLPELFNLLIELSQADPNVTNALRAHFGFTEDMLCSSSDAWRARWIGRIGDRETVGSGVSETGEAKVGQFDTVLRPDGAQWRLDGRKFYPTGSLFADWIHVAAQDEAGVAMVAAVPVRAPGVEILDDWDGFGQALTASGTAVFTNVGLGPELIKPDPERFPYAMAFFQLVHLATLAGIGRSAALDVRVSWRSASASTATATAAVRATTLRCSRWSGACAARPTPPAPSSSRRPSPWNGPMRCIAPVDPPRPLRPSRMSRSTRPSAWSPTSCWKPPRRCSTPSALRR